MLHCLALAEFKGLEGGVRVTPCEMPVGVKPIAWHSDAANDEVHRFAPVVADDDLSEYMRHSMPRYRSK